MIFHEVEMNGKFFLEELNSLPTWTIDDKKRIIKVNDELYFGGNTDWINLTNKIDLTTHINDNENPHSITTEQISAASTTDLTIVSNNLTAHIVDKENPHEVTLEQIGGVSTTDLTVHINNSAVHNPVGSIIIFGGTTPPTGYLECNGTLISQTTYSELYSVIGSTFGTGTGTFGLPDLRGEFIRGWDHGRNIDNSRQFGSFQNEEFKEHNHELLDSASANIGSNNELFPYAHGTNGATGYSAFTQKTGGDETRPRNIALLYCIKY